MTKLDPNGSRLGYSTFLGGTALDFGRAIAIDADRTRTSPGERSPPTSPRRRPSGGTTAGDREAFVVKLDRHGR